MDRRAMSRALNRLAAEANKQSYMVYGAACISLNEYWGWSTKRLEALMDEVVKAWNENCNNPTTSAIKMLDDETGIELSIGTKSYKELRYLDGESKPRPMTTEEIVWMRGQQTKWMGAQVTAILFLALHRRYGFGSDRLERLLMQMDEVRASKNWKPTSIAYEVKQRVGIDLRDHIG